MKNKLLRRTAASCLCIITFLAFASSASTLVFADEITDLEKKITNVSKTLEEYQKQENALQQAVNSAKTDKDKAAVRRNNISQQISVTENEIAELEKRIGFIERKIQLREEAVDNKKSQIAETYDLFKLRLRASYMQGGTTNNIGLVIGAGDFADFLTRSEYVSRIGKHDKDLVEKLLSQQKNIEEEKASLEADIQALNSDKQTTGTKKLSLAEQYTEAAKEVSNIAQMEKEYLADLSKNKAIQDQMKKEMDTLFRELEYSRNPYAGGKMAWPVPGFTRLTSGFGRRFAGSDFHTGNDIAGNSPGAIMGAKIVAANDGVVSIARTTYQNGVGYGMYVAIDHGMDGDHNVATLYAHTSKILVTVGQKVKRGEVIALVGSTGWSSGPHLHFEVRIDGTAVDSLPYIQ